MSGSSQHWLDRNRPPRVQITYDVETGGAVEKKELPYVVGILASLSGESAKQLPPLKKRKFVEIDRDNFNQVLKAAGPRLSFKVPNHLNAEGGTLNVELAFQELDDFDPYPVLMQIPELEQLLATRQHLSDLVTKLDGNDELEGLLAEVVVNTEGLKQLQPPTPGA